MEPAAFFVRMILLLGLSMGFRTVVEIRRTIAKGQRSSGAGLTELPYRANCDGDENVIRIITRAAETGDQYFIFEETALNTSSGFFSDRPGSPPPHIHKSQTETFTVLEGVFNYVAAGVEASAKVGDQVVVLPGVAHTWWVGDSLGGRTTVNIKLAPAGKHAEDAFETLAGFSRDFNCTAKVSPLQMMLWADAQEMTLAFVPVYMRPIVSWLLVPLARVIGYDAVYREYSTLSRSEFYENRRIRENTPYVHPKEVEQEITANLQGEEVAPRVVVTPLKGAEEVPAASEGTVDSREDESSLVSEDRKEQKEEL